MSQLEIEGFGVAVGPRGPARLWLRSVGGRSVLHLSSIGEDRVREAQLLPPILEPMGASGNITAVRLAPSEVIAALHGFDDPLDVVAWRRAPTSVTWAIRSLGCEIPWPRGFFLQTTPSDSGWPFELIGPYTDDRSAESVASSSAAAGMILIRGPIDVGAMKRDDLVAAGQRLIARGGSDEVGWVELDYQGETGLEVQRHELVRIGDSLVLVTAQGPESAFAGIREAAAEVARLRRVPLGRN